MKKIISSACIVLGSSLLWACEVHESASVGAAAPPPPVVQGQATVGVQAEVVVEGEPPPPPPPPVEAPPPPPSPEHVWVVGYQRWNGTTYVWVPGRYERRPQPAAVWTPAHWEARGHQHVWIEGNWQGSATATVAPAPAPAPASTVEVVVEGPPPTPPPVVVETQPPAPSPEHVWVVGYHRWDGPTHKYVWTPGRWERRPHPGAQWKPAHWEPRGNRHVWIEGNWDATANANAKVEEHPVAAGPAPAAGAPGAHPYYLHALSDLRNARANLEKKGGDKAMKWDEREAVGAIDRAIKDIKEAALDDGKNLQDHPQIDAKEPRNGRLHKALDALRTARADIDREEDNAFARGLRARASHDIDEAIRFTEAGVQAAAAVQ